MQYEQYTIVIRPDSNGTFIAHIPAIPGCHAYGKNAIEAQQELKHVFEMIQEEYQEENKTLPPDCKVTAANAC